jgi:hypothetical protein
MAVDRGESDHTLRRAIALNRRLQIEAGEHDDQHTHRDDDAAQDEANGQAVKHEKHSGESSLPKLPGKY